MNHPTALIPAEDWPRPPEGIDLLDWYGYRVSCIEWARSTAKARCAAILAQCDREAAWLEAQCGRAFEAAVARAIERQPGKARSIKLGTCTAGYRRTRGAVVIEDDAALLAEIDRRPNLAGLARVEQRRIVSKTAVREHFEGSGEVLPGVRVDPGGDVFYCRADMKAGAAATGVHHDVEP